MNYSIKFQGQDQQDLEYAWQYYLAENRNNPLPPIKSVNEFILRNCMDAIHDYLEGK